MKGQLSLEMVIMLVVLLVVAGVVITLVLHFMRPERVGKLQESATIDISTFISNCKSLCESNVEEYCQYYWQGDDWNKNNIRGELIKVGVYNWYACEDRIYCFLVQPCDRLGHGIELMRKCRDIICQRLLEKYENVDSATKALLQTIKFSDGKCSFSNLPETENWYNKVFKDGCKATVLGEEEETTEGGETGGGPGAPPLPPS